MKIFKYCDSYLKDPTLINSEISKLADAFNSGVKMEYKPYCNGLGARSNILLLNYNITNESFSYLCQFIPQLSKKHGASIDIFDEELFDKSIEYQHNRILSIKKHCLNCSVIGICKGGCILNGLDAFNKKNEGACSFWEKIWTLYLMEYITEESK